MTRKSLWTQRFLECGASSSCIRFGSVRPVYLSRQSGDCIVADAVFCMPEQISSSSDMVIGYCVVIGITTVCEATRTEAEIEDMNFSFLVTTFDCEAVCLTGRFRKSHMRTLCLTYLITRIV